MNQTQSTLQRFLTGFYRIARGFLWVIAAAGGVLLAAAVITLPLWLMATRFGRVFDYGLLTILAALTVLGIWRRLTKRAIENSTRRKRDRFVGWFALVVVLCVGVAGVVLSAPAVVIVSLAGALGFFAWVAGGVKT